MKKEEKILSIVNEKGYIMSKDLSRKKINAYYLSKLVKENKLVRVSRGYYVLPNGFPDNFYIILSKCKKAVFSHATALYLHNLSERCPLV